MALLVRTWNLYHGRTKPNSGHADVGRAVALVAGDEPDIVGLQEVPVWALRHLEEWSGMTAVPGLARRPLGGPFARRVTALAPDVFRSALAGQANAVLVRRAHRVVGTPRAFHLNPRYPRERRVCQIVDVEAAGRRLRVANFHATAHDERQARKEVARVAELVAGEDAAIVCGDFNVRALGLPGFSRPLPRIDQILARGLEFERGPEAWPTERRRLGERTLSDHAPVEAVLTWP